ncbi:hypothetical protein [Brevibacillus parabrevis]|uniref:hypothetical protein n=1 Tax=Brevibacillus parabrevis TaxID=54914 RepID=UPI001F60DB19|nr:hypothetical protein [Brevibacillus parabrevis]
MRNKQDTDEFRELADYLAHVELDDQAARDRIYNRLANKLKAGKIQAKPVEKDEIVMKKSSWKTVAASVAAIVCLTGAFSTTSFAQEMLSSILARFQVGNLQIVQYDKEPVAPASENAAVQAGADGARAVTLQPRPNLTVQEARAVLGSNFPAPSWVADYEYVNTVVHGDSMAEVQYAHGDKTVNFLISKGGENGIGTTEEVKTQVLNGTKVYMANGIVIWEKDGYTIELYAQDDFAPNVLGKIIDGFSTGAPLTQTEIEQAREKLKNAPVTEGAGPAPAPAPVSGK